MQYTVIFKVVKNENFQKKSFDIFSYFCSKHRLWVHIRTCLTSTHNIYFGAKIRKIGILVHTQVLLYKSGVQGEIYYMGMFCELFLEWEKTFNLRIQVSFVTQCTSVYTCTCLWQQCSTKGK